MALMEVNASEFKRSAEVWLRKAQAGETVIITSAEGPSLTLKASSSGVEHNWDEHFAKLKQQPQLAENPVDVFHRRDGR